MEKWLLAVGYDPYRFGAAQCEWIKQGLLIHMVDSLTNAVAALPTRDYAFIAIHSERQDPLLFLPWLRAQTSIPIVILSPEDDERERQEAIRLGAEAYIPWEGSVKETMKHSAAIQHLCPGKNGKEVISLSHRELIMCPEYQRVFVHGTEVHLTPKEFGILRYLLENKGIKLSYDQIYAHVWDKSYVSHGGNRLWNHIKRIRAKVAFFPKAADYIQNIHGYGYKIDAE